jgi:hypothetical protein
MRKTALAAAVLSLAFAAPVWAAGGGQPTTGPTPNFDERKAEVLKKVDEQMIILQEAKVCIKAAKNHDDLRTCREKHMAEAKQLREGKQNHPNGQ